MSPRLIAPIVVAVVALVPARAYAQHCHVDVPDDHDEGVAGDDAADMHHMHHGHHGHHAPPRRWWLGASSAAIAGSGTVAGEARDYQGLSLALHGGWRRLSARGVLPAYRVADEGVGLGDALGAVAADVVPGRGRVRAGLALSASLPTGDSDAGRGMGHAMIAAGGWARAPVGPIRADVAAMWARALGDGAEHIAHRHLSAMWPLVDPMNPEEIVVDGRGTAAIGRRVRAGVGGTYGAPLSTAGVVRLITYAVAEVTRGRHELAAQLAAPMIGDPFVARATVELTYRY